MTPSRTETAEARSLDILGIGEAEERVYRRLLARPDSTVSEIAQALILTPSKVQRLIDGIEAKGLTTHTPERPRRYIPVSPDIAIEALVRRRQEELDRAHMTIPELQRQAVRSKDAHARIVELITNREVERHAFEQMHLTARHEVVVLVKSPIRISRLKEPRDYETQREAQAKGVHYRSIVDAEYLALPGAVHRTREDMKAGEEVRVVTNLPFKAAIADRRLAIIPLNLQQADSPSLLVRSSALLDGLYALFEMLWASAAPLSFTRAGELEAGIPDSGLPEDARELLSLMAAGINDKGIVYELGISRSTHSRRIVEIMKTLRARTRFQLGWLAALRLSANSVNGQSE